MPGDPISDLDDASLGSALHGTGRWICARERLRPRLGAILESMHFCIKARGRMGRHARNIPSTPCGRGNCRSTFKTFCQHPKDALSPQTSTQPSMFVSARTTRIQFGYQGTASLALGFGVRRAARRELTSV